MEICEVPTLRLKALNNHSITHIQYIEMEMLSAIYIYIKLTHHVDKGFSSMKICHWYYTLDFL